jgi:hypothetical protein
MLYLEYVHMLSCYRADSVGEVNRDDAAAWELDAEDDHERIPAWSYAFERNDEARDEMDYQDRLGFT